MIRQLDDKMLVSGQIAPHEVAGLAEQGVTMLVNNRPDGEEPDQPLAAEIEEAADGRGHRLSLRADHPRHRPGRRRGDAARRCARRGDGKLLAFCRSGTRSALAWRAREARGGRVRAKTSSSG